MSKQGRGAMKLHKLYMVEWVDSVQPVASWHALDDLPELAVVQCISVGWLVAKSKEVIMLAPNLGGGEDVTQQGSGFIRIPVASIVSKKVVG